jgi:hypothetical protein
MAATAAGPPGPRTPGTAIARVQLVRALLSRRPPVHPLLAGAHPVLYFYGANIDKMSASEIVLPVAVVWLAVGLVWLVAAKALGGIRAGAIAATLSVLLFCLLIPAYRLAIGVGLPKVPALAAVILLFGASALPIVVGRRRLDGLSGFLDHATVVATVLLVGTIVMKGVALDEVSLSQHGFETAVPPGASHPDIYYIVLDGYGRSDVLRELYDYDNSAILKKLEGLGFYVASAATSNYSQTMLSLSSSLNMTYLDTVAEQLGTQSNERAALKRLIADSRVVRRLKALGYRFVTFPSGFSGTQALDGVDLTMSSGYTPTEFHNLLIGRSPMPAMLAGLGVAVQDWQHAAHRRRIDHIFDTLPALGTASQPQFVFAHVLSPHPPFVFGSDGTPLNPPREFSFNDGSGWVREGGRPAYLKGYAAQAQYIGARAADAASRILARNSNAVIIIQGDHGPGAHLNMNSYSDSNMRERMAILNAYHVPPVVRERLYAKVSSVNSFRLVLGHLFGPRMEALQDEAYFSPWRAPYDFVHVTDEVNRPGPAPSRHDPVPAH